MIELDEHDAVGHYRNVGTVDRFARSLLAPLVVVASGYALRTSEASWILPIILFAFVLVAYLLMTANIAFDFAYAMMDVSTVRGPHHLRAPHPRPRGRQRAH